MILQTIQPVSVLESLNKDLIVFSKPNYSLYDENPDDWSFQKSYDWLKKQMLSRGILPQNNESDVFWAWAWSGDRDKKEVDMRTRKYCKYNEPHVLLTLEKDSKDILLSDYELWHFVLNYWALATSSKEEQYWEKICKNNEHNYYNIKPSPLYNEQIEKSWEIIFSLEEKEDGFYYSDSVSKKNQKYLNTYEKKQIVQATFWNIQLSDIRKIQYLKF